MSTRAYDVKVRGVFPLPTPRTGVQTLRVRANTRRVAERVALRACKDSGWTGAHVASCVYVPPDCRGVLPPHGFQPDRPEDA